MRAVTTKACAITLARVLALAVLLLIAAPGAGYAAPCDPGKHTNNPHCDPDPVAATPELSSVVLFGAGLIGLAGVALHRRRTGRRP